MQPTPLPRNRARPAPARFFGRGLSLPARPPIFLGGASAFLPARPFFGRAVKKNRAGARPALFLPLNRSFKTRLEP